MAREYRIECDEFIDQLTALEMLSRSPCFRKPPNTFEEGEVWLSLTAKPNYPDVRLFPRSFGFFLEITTLPEELSELLESWISRLRSLGECSIIDNDTEEVVRVLR
jgi:hypothetical protein